MRTYWQVHCERAVYAFAAGQRGQPLGIDVVPSPPTMIAIDVEPDSMFPQRLPHIVLVTCRLPQCSPVSRVAQTSRIGTSQSIVRGPCGIRLWLARLSDGLETTRDRKT